eukprot:m.119179 g.119179  ORF g.119179 m.119179 type:complete len:238 (-) comp11008_c0_seq3:1408-2121(-)
MSFLKNLMGKMEKPPERDPEVEAMKRQAREAELALRKQEEEEEARFTAHVQSEVDTFIKSAATMKRFPPMKSAERAIVHTISAKAKLYPLAFGDDTVDDRSVVVFKEAVRPSDKDVELMDRELPYDACMEALRATQKKIAEEEAIDRQQRQKTASAAPPVVTAKPSAKQQRIAQMVGDVSVAVAPKQSGGYGMVPAHLRQDKRSLEEIEKDIREKKRARKEKEPTTKDGDKDSTQDS